MTFDESWIVPQGGPPWLAWGFGTRRSLLPEQVAHGTQVHGSAVLTVSGPGLAGQGDALITATPGLLLGIKTADCLPLLMVDPARRAVAAVHAGWRGTAQQIARAAVQAMQKNYETNPIDLVVAMGPAIQSCCFEVGAEVAREFTDYDPDLRKVTGKCNLDLQEINAWQLQQLGISSENILRTQVCTMCGGEELWSYRKEGPKAGRMWSLIGLTL